MAAVIHWFRRDLRLADNTALSAAASAGTVVPVFVLDPQILRRPDTGAARFDFLCHGLRALDADLRQRGSQLLVRRGDPASVLRDIAQRQRATRVFFNRDYEPYATRRDARVAAALRSAGIRVETFKDDVIAELGDLPGPRPFQVFTPFYRAWASRLTTERPAAATAVRLVRAEAIDSDPLPQAGELPRQHGVVIPEAGHAAGVIRLERFAAGGLTRYAGARDRLDGEPTARVSYFLRFGMVSVRECLGIARRHQGPGSDAWVRQLAWRDFYRQLLAALPRLETEPMDQRLGGLAWNDSAAALGAWREGLTGYPVVDAAMRQLAQEAWLPNRARLIVASFLVKDLGVDWRAGEHVFMDRLLDGDLANNNGGWQWVAGTGADPQPFFRVFNPVLQGQRFDPDGDYVRRWCPELAGVPTQDIHQPWVLSETAQRECGCRIGRDYPRPMVDHGAAHRAALARFTAARATAGASTGGPRSRGGSSLSPRV